MAIAFLVAMLAVERKPQRTRAGADMGKQTGCIGKTLWGNRPFCTMEPAPPPVPLLGVRDSDGGPPCAPTACSSCGMSGCAPTAASATTVEVSPSGSPYGEEEVEGSASTTSTTSNARSSPTRKSREERGPRRRRRRPSRVGSLPLPPALGSLHLASGRDPAVTLPPRLPHKTKDCMGFPRVGGLLTRPGPRVLVVFRGWCVGPWPPRLRVSR